MHMAQMHQRSDLAPIIKESSSLEKQKSDKKAMGTSKESDIWFEIFKSPSFNVKPVDKLMIPNHVFVKGKIYKKIQRRQESSNVR